MTPSISNDTVEKVAAAIHNAYFAHDWENENDTTSKQLIYQSAKAAIEALLASGEVVVKDKQQPVDCREAFEAAYYPCYLEGHEHNHPMRQYELFWRNPSGIYGWIDIEALYKFWMAARTTPKREMGTHRLVIVESPYAGDIEANVEYARKCVRDSLLRGEAPIASHLLYTQPGVLKDEIPAERQHGIDAGLAWRKVASVSVVYTDLGISKGMEYGIKAAEAEGISVEYRSIV